MPVTFQVVGNLADFGNDPRADVLVRAHATPSIKVGDVAVHSNEPEAVKTDGTGAFTLTLVSLPGVWYRIHTPYSGAIRTVNLAGYIPDSVDPTTGEAFPDGTVINLLDVVDEDPAPSYAGIAHVGAVYDAETAAYVADPTSATGAAVAEGISGAVDSAIDAEEARADSVYVRTTVSEGRYRRTLSELRVLEAGADAAPTIQAALNAAGGTTAAELVLPEGEYDLDSAILTMNVPNVRLVGAGRGKTRLNVTGDRDGIKAGGTAGSPVAGLHIEGLSIYGTGSGVANPNQRCVNVDYATAPTLRDLILNGAGNNGLNVFHTDGGTVDNVEVSDARDFGVLTYQSRDVTFRDVWAHDIDLAGRAHLGLQLKSSKRCRVFNLRAERIAGYGFYTWNDGIDDANYYDEGHSLVDATIRNMLSGGTFSPTAAYINLTRQAQIRGGVFDTSAGGLIAAASTVDLAICDVSVLRGSAASTIGISGTSSFRVNNVHANGGGTGNPIGIIVSGAPTYGSVRNSSFINGSAGGSTDNAACRIESTVTGLFIEHNDFSDYQTVKTQRRGIYDRRTAAGVNYWRFNRATGNTGTNKTIPAGSVDTDNVTV